MAQDLRDLMKEYEPQTPKLSAGHETRFEQKLDAIFAEKQRRPYFLWLRIAAILIVVVSIGYAGYRYLSEPTIKKNTEIVTTDQGNETPIITLGDLSPDLKKVEDFYTTGINVQLASLQKTPENEEIINGYLQRLEELDKAYQALNAELNKVGPSEATITALIDNLKLRLEVLFKLKNKLKELKELNDENYSEFTT